MVRNFWPSLFRSEIVSPSLAGFSRPVSRGTFRSRDHFARIRREFRQVASCNTFLFIFLASLGALTAHAQTPPTITTQPADKTVSQVAEQGGHRLVADRVPLLSQRRRQLPGALVGPAQGGHRISAGCRGDQGFVYNSRYDTGRQQLSLLGNSEQQRRQCDQR